MYIEYRDIFLKEIFLPCTLSHMATSLLNKLTSCVDRYTVDSVPCSQVVFLSVCALCF